MFKKSLKAKLMKKTELKKRLSSNPYRGIITEVAKEQGVTPQAVWNALYLTENPRITEIVTQKIITRKETYNRAQRILEAC